MGSWHVVLPNSNYIFVPTAAGPAQELWLKSDLAGASGKCILAVWHHPRFYSSTTSPLSAGTATLPFWNDLYAAHADVIVNGHMHDYERFEIGRASCRERVEILADAEAVKKKKYNTQLHQHAS